MTNHVQADIPMPGSAPFPYLNLAHNSSCRAPSPARPAPRSPSGPLSRRERVRVRALHRPNQPEQNRTGSNESTRHRVHRGQPGLTKPDRPQPPIPRKTLVFRPVRRSEDSSADHRPPARQITPTVAGNRWNRPNQPEQTRTTSNESTRPKAHGGQPRLTKPDHCECAIPCKTLEKHWRSCLVHLKKKSMLTTRTSDDHALPNNTDETRVGSVS